VTICSSGRMDWNLESGYFATFLEFLQNNNVSFGNIKPSYAAGLMSEVIVDWLKCLKICFEF
jgi:hypothetical protein